MSTNRRHTKKPTATPRPTVAALLTMRTTRGNSPNCRKIATMTFIDAAAMNNRYGDYLVRIIETEA